MRILLTGCTFLQVQPKRRQIEKIDVPQSIVDGLRRLGHEVDWRAVDLGEDLSGYDLAWVCLAPINSVNARRGAIGAMWTFAQRGNLPLVGFFDDWQFSSVFNGFRTLVRHPERLYHRLHLKSGKVERFFLDATDEQTQPHADRLIETAAAMLGPGWPAIQPVVPMYRWGDRSEVRRRMPKELTRIYPLDPSPTIYDMLGRHSPAEEKDDRWALAALMPHGDWLDRKVLTWPVDVFGARKMVKERQGERLKTEDDVIEAYARRWGVLSPPYNHAGSGWWRSRFLYAAKVGSVLACDRNEAASLGDPYAVSAREVESLPVAQRAGLAAAQRDALRPWLTTDADWLESLNEIVTLAKGRT